MTETALTVLAKVLDTSVYPGTGARHRWLVRLQVEDVIEGELPDGQQELSVLVHSPSRAFRDSNPVGETFRITFEDPVEDPYAGRLEIARDSQQSAQE